MPEPNCVCKTCGRAFYAKPSQIRLRNGGQHCSRACFLRDHNARLRGPDHPQWKGEDALETTARGRAQRLFNLGPCEECGQPGVDRHHKDGDPHHNVPENIAILCRRCHMLADGRLDRLRTAQNRKVTAAQVADIRQRYDALPVSGSRKARGVVAEFTSLAAQEFGICEETVRAIATRRSRPIRSAA